MQIDWWTLVLQAVNLLVLVAILGRFLFRPMARIVEERQAEAQRLLDDAASARDAAQQADREAQARRDSVVIDRKAIVEDARKEAEKQRAALLRDTEAEIARQRSEAAEQITRLKHTENARVGHRANALAIDIAHKLLEGPARGLPVSSFFNGFEKALKALPQPSRDAISGDPARAELTVARPLDKAEGAMLDAMIKRNLGKQASFTPRVDPALIAGLRLAGGGVEIDASLRDGLGRIAAGLAAEPEQSDEGG
ncbi:F0F1 ATP synthase subunit delta [Novosphingobium sp. ZN18A2]|uniref:F0F1 ATP synthase subunit delta n=1 Tax=Novosphingobium sp. ZN18A2 TaxID=3079861 RepID=UPI0030D113DF